MIPLPTLGIALLLSALPPLLLAGRALRRHRPLRATLWIGPGALLALSGILALLLAGQIQLYQRLTYERPVAELQVWELAPRRYRLLLDDGRRLRLFTLHGDQWRLDAQVLVWRGPARLLGLEARYRLDRLSGRYRDPQLEARAPRSVHDLTPDTPLPAWLRLPLDELPWADTRYGSSAYMDLEDGARYQIRLTPTGLIARRLD